MVKLFSKNTNETEIKVDKGLCETVQQYKENEKWLKPLVK